MRLTASRSRRGAVRKHRRRDGSARVTVADTQAQARRDLCGEFCLSAHLERPMDEDALGTMKAIVEHGLERLIVLEMGHDCFSDSLQDSLMVEVAEVAVQLFQGMLAFGGVTMRHMCCARHVCHAERNANGSFAELSRHGTW